MGDENEGPMSKREGGMVVRRRREVERLHGEVLEPYPRVTVPAPRDPVAHPIPSRTDDRRVLVEHHEHHHHHPPAPLAQVASTIRWDRLAAYVMGLAMLVFVLWLLFAAGVIDLHALRPPWQETKP